MYSPDTAVPGSVARAAAALPRLILVTHDEIVARRGFLQLGTLLMQECGPRVALQLRAKELSAAALYEYACELARPAHETGALLFVNERIDIALAAGADGVQLGRRAVPVAAAKAFGPMRIGASVHSADEAGRAAADGADLLVLGTIWATASHPGRPGSGIGLVAQAQAAAVTVPLYAIGGVTPPRAREVLDAGAHGVAVITGVWDAADPVAAALSLLEAMQVKS